MSMNDVLAEARAERRARTERANALIEAAMTKAFSRFGLSAAYIDKNTVDAFTAALLDAGVDLDDLDDVLAEGDIAKVGE